MLKKGEKPYFQITQNDGSKTRLGGPGWEIASTKGSVKKYVDSYEKIDWSNGRTVKPTRPEESSGS